MKINNLVLRDFFISLFVFLPSIANVPLILHLLIIPFIISKKFRVTQSLLLLLGIVVLSTINQIANFHVFLNEGKGLKDLIPFSLFMLVSYYFAINVNRRILRYIVFFIIFEIVIGILEYLYGVRSFIPSVRDSVSGVNPFGYKGLLYYSRVSGLSTNSSAFAMKIFAGILIVHFLDFRNNQKKIAAYSFLAIGLFITFTRSVYVALAFFILIANINLIKRILAKFLLGKTKLFYIILSGITLIGFLTMISKIDLIIKQLNRGMQSADLSSRDIVFQKFYSFITDNFWLGNGSYKLWIMINDKLFHAHNVFLQILSTNGIIISSFYFVFIIININKINFKYIFPILVLSFFQYAIFWGISFLDLVFFSFLLIKFNKTILHTK